MLFREQAGQKILRPGKIGKSAVQLCFETPLEDITHLRTGTETARNEMTPLQDRFGRRSRDPERGAARPHALERFGFFRENAFGEVS